MVGPVGDGHRLLAAPAIAPLFPASEAQRQVLNLDSVIVVSFQCHSCPSVRTY
jgi:hypothetical protein